jgi:methylated-DNA-[protein]-cysteine S-methyltransferase
MTMASDIHQTTSFETAIGSCAICWTERGISAVRLPGRSVAGAAAPTTEPQPVRAAIDAISALLAGEPSDLSWIELDLEGVGAFDRRVGAVARTILPGRTLTYGEVAARVGAPGEAREVGAALGRNRFPLIVPCHRVVAANGKLGGFSAPGGRATKLRLLEIERAHAQDALSLFG